MPVLQWGFTMTDQILNRKAGFLLEKLGYRLVLAKRINDRYTKYVETDDEKELDYCISHSKKKWAEYNGQVKL